MKREKRETGRRGGGRRQVGSQAGMLLSPASQVKKNIGNRRAVSQSCFVFWSKCLALVLAFPPLVVFVFCPSSVYIRHIVRVGREFLLPFLVYILPIQSTHPYTSFSICSCAAIH